MDPENGKRGCSPGRLVSLAVVLVVSRQGEVSREEHVYRMRLHRVPEAELDPDKTRLTRRMPAVMVAYTTIFTTLFMAYYIGPFQQATGTDAMIEIIVLLSGPVIWLATAVLAWWMIRKSYG